MTGVGRHIAQSTLATGVLSWDCIALMRRYMVLAHCSGLGKVGLIRPRTMAAYGWKPVARSPGGRTWGFHICLQDVYIT